MPDLAQTIVGIAVAIGVPAALATLARGIYQQITGRAGRERQRNSEYLARSIRDAELAESEAAKRRKAQEYASALRREAIEHGYNPAPWPDDLDNTITPAEVKKIRNRKKDQ